MVAAVWIVVLGMAIVFAVLGVLLGAMVLLEKLTKPKAEHFGAASSSESGRTETFREEQP